MNNSVQKIVANHLCQGCGACFYICDTKAIQLQDYTDIGIRPTIYPEKCTNCGDCLRVCSGFELSHVKKDWPPNIIPELSFSWGPVLELWEGYATDSEIRFKGGSGGAATAISLFCINHKNMHGVLHAKANPSNPHLSTATLNTSYDSVLGGAASRYCPVAICAELGLLADAPEKCVLVGKPCEIASSIKVLKVKPDLLNKLGVTISIFCGGTPSTRGTLKLIENLGIEAEEIEDLRYRGHGWPGMTGIKLRNQEGRIEMPYQQAWDTILTKHKPFRCHICPDGTGEFADISCGDPWYRKKVDNDQGSTLLLVRTERGKEILQGAISAGYICAEQRPPSILPLSQSGLLHRRQHIINKLLWLKIFNLPSPTYSGFYLLKNWMNLSVGRKIQSLWNTGKWVYGIKKNGPLHLRP